jgi:GMP synthase (glutamine-hydrolysing)
MKRAIVLQHVPFEGPGRIAEALERVGYDILIRRLCDGDPVPADMAEQEVLVVMGGPMGVNDEDLARYPFLSQELDLLQRSIVADRAVLGVCLGSQLLARAAGARVFRNLHQGRWVREVGWAPVAFHDVDRRQELAGLSASEVMLHWHGDTFDLPAGATLLASTDGCRNQAFRLTHGGRPGRQIGLQFHCEVDAPTITDWLREDADYVASTLGADGAARIRDDTARYEPHHRQVSRRLLDNIVAALIAPA